MLANTRRYTVWAMSCLALFLVSTPAEAQTPQKSEKMVTLNFPGETDIKALIDYVSDRLEIKIFYDQSIASKKINIRAPGEVPVDSLLDVLKSALKINGLALVDAEAPGWMRIVTGENMPGVAIAGTADEAIRKHGRSTPVTQTFILKYADPQKVDQAIKPFLTKPGANSIVSEQTGALIVTDYASAVLNIGKLIEMLDRPRADVSVEAVPIKHVAAKTLAEQLNQLMTARRQASGREGQAVQVVTDERTNHLLIVGRQVDIEQLRSLITRLDIPLGVTTKTYLFQFVSAERIDRLVKALINPITSEQLYRSSVESEENLLIATTTPEIHRQIETLRMSRDVAGDGASSPIRFYKVKNLPVAELLTTIKAIESQTTPAPVSPKTLFPSDGRSRPIGSQFAPNLEPVQPEPTSPAIETPAIEDGTAKPSDQSASSLLGRARVSADIHTNTMIVIADPQVQRFYAELIEKLDQRRPQVLIESQLVIIDTSDDFSLGVEISGGDGKGDKRALAFTSFGLSSVDPTSGALSLLPGLGFNGTVVDADIADVVLRALTSHRRSRVISAPKILVNDNATGQLTSVSEVPYTSINASNTVATTSFAGFAEAGTTITVTPRIADEDHLQLDFSITLNTFTGSGGDGVPPPRQTDEVTSQITIPDGSTVIVGGLNRKSKSEEVRSFPFIEHIPLLRLLGGSEARGESHTSMFIFLRPVILRDDKFKDLKFLSKRDGGKADLNTGFPTSEPVWIK